MVYQFKQCYRGLAQCKIVYYLPTLTPKWVTTYTILRSPFKILSLYDLPYFLISKFARSPTCTLLESFYGARVIVSFALACLLAEQR